MLVEHVLTANGATSIRRFDQKTAALAQRPATLPVPLDGRPDLWDRLAAVYVALQDARHAVTHRRAQIGPAGELQVYDNTRRLTDTLSTTELRAFAAAVHALAEAVIDGDSDPRRANIVAWHLNALGPRHALPPLVATDPDAGRRPLIKDLIPLPDGRLRLDVARVREIASGQPPGVWDLELRAGHRVFVGRWGTFPTTRTPSSISTRRRPRTGFRSGRRRR
jgi:hypothetical protein